MKIYIIKITDQHVVDQVVAGNEFVHDGIYNFEGQLRVGDPIIIYFGGDKAQISWDQGVRGVGKVTTAPFDKGYDPAKPKNFKIKVQPLNVLDSSIPPKAARTHSRFAPDIYEIPYIGANHFPTQAISSYEKPAGIKALAALYNEYGNFDFGELSDDDALFTSALRHKKLSDFSGVASALQAKPFLILTGLSGSGKTLQALSFAKWICPNKADLFYEKLKRALVSEIIVENYDVHSCSPQTVELVNKRGNSGKIIPLPVGAIEEWYLALKNGVIDADKDPKNTRHTVGESSSYQKYIHGFYTELKKLGDAVLELPDSGERKTGPLQYEIISVGADWTSNENLLGYPDALKPKSYRKPDNGALDLILRAQADPENPYFLILDEMNLSHVERYFADFLSAMESGEAISLHDDTGADWNGVPAKLTIPKNLFVIGTVNVDETTYMFSPKVLDRANVIEFRVSEDEMESFLANPAKPDLDAIAGQGAAYGKAFVAAAKQKDVSLDDTTRAAVSKVLMAFFPPLKAAGAEFGYRTAHEICRFVYFHKELTSKDWKLETAMDTAIMQKLLPKLHGSKKKLGPVLTVLIWHCLKEEARPEKMDTPVKDEDLIAANALYPGSLEKLARMRKRLAEHGFASFAEA
ncbi:hypothetical protein [Pontiella agarivorans]|uniref:Uncharacterized protein n=1 Tax=Pontiella agarivorans TaxID=3038953 RepID=A0ABU5MVT9_9BACT|nr:hypothetical protein [Pontiella agarivorans]MDZ8118201.1 hypothetical protein [Pontiella agarivorans]